MEKEKDIKIVSVSATSYANVDGESFIRVFGLGEDNVLYEWEFSRQCWELN